MFPSTQSIMSESSLTILTSIQEIFAMKASEKCRCKARDTTVENLMKFLQLSRQKLLLIKKKNFVPNSKSS